MEPSRAWAAYDGAWSPSSTPHEFCKFRLAGTSYLASMETEGGTKRPLPPRTVDEVCDFLASVLSGRSGNMFEVHPTSLSPRTWSFTRLHVSHSWPRGPDQLAREHTAVSDAESPPFDHDG